MGPRLFSRGEFVPYQGQPGVRRASMGPRLFSRGEVRPDGQAGAQATRFNGAAAFQPRRVGGGGGAQSEQRASMGPRLFSRGEFALSHFFGGGLKSFNGAAAFQPRRGCSVSRRVPNCNASMGPRLFSRGERYAQLPLDYASVASMGPRLFSRGEAFLARMDHSTISLQWGRGFSAAESPRDARPSAPCGGFNGAAAFQPRRGMDRANDYLYQAMLQWGRGFSAAESLDVDRSRICS